ncbi:MAG: alpha-xylosidase, partial [Luteolibacter sp.]
MTKINLIARLTAVTGMLLAAGTALAAPPAPLLNEPVDVSADFKDLSNTYFLADKLAEFDPATRCGKLTYLRHLLGPKHAFDNTLTAPSPAPGNEFPTTEYAANPELPFSIEFISPRVVRIRASTGVQSHQEESLMLAGPLSRDESWKLSETPAGYCYTSEFGSVTVTKDPWHVEFRDATGRLL